MSMCKDLGPGAAAPDIRKSVEFRGASRRTIGSDIAGDRAQGATYLLHPAIAAARASHPVCGGNRGLQQ